MQLRLANQRYHCRQCGRCCRSFRPALTRLEVEAIARLPWPHTPPTRNFYTVFNGQPCLSKKEDGSCIYLDSDSRCIMHTCFGASCKALTCRAYPFELLATFPGEISVAARYDCPAVNEGHGDWLASMRGALQTLAQDPQLHLGSGFKPDELAGLTREAVETITDFYIHTLSSGSHAAVLETLTTALEKLAPSFLNDIETLKEVLPSMLDKAKRQSSPAARLLGSSWPERIWLRRDLAYYLRRDERLLKLGWRARFKQCKAIAALLFGGGNARAFSPEHPDFPIRSARLFNNGLWNSSPDQAFNPYREFLSTRLTTLQFFGRAYYGEPFFKGLKALLGTWRPAEALARLNAAANQRSHTAEEDFRLSRAIIDPCFGRRLRKP